MIAVMILPALALLLFILGITGLVKRRLKIFDKYELTGLSMYFLSVLYILVSIVAFIIMEYYSWYMIIGIPLLAVVVGVVTMIVVISKWRK